MNRNLNKIKDSMTGTKNKRKTPNNTCNSNITQQETREPIDKFDITDISYKL